MNGEGGPRQAAHTITIDTPSLDQDDLNLGYRLGYGAGYETGFAHGWNARDNELQAFFGLYRSLSERRRHAELEAIRSDTTPRRCRDECRQCSALCPPRASNPQLGQIPVAGFPRRWPVIAYGYVEDGAQVLAAVEAFLRRFVAYPSDHAAVAVTLWPAHTHVVDRFESSPRLACLSPEPGSGKTRNLEVLDRNRSRSHRPASQRRTFTSDRVSDGASCRVSGTRRR